MMNSMKPAVLMMATLLATPAGAAALKPPPGYAQAVTQHEHEPHPCPTDAQPFTGALDFPSKYEGSDKARDDLNPKAEAEYRRLIAPISAMEKGFSQQVEDYLRSGDASARQCALDLLRNWAAAGALQGTATTHTGKSMRKWALASIASSYLRLQRSSSQPLKDERALATQTEAWIARLAERVVDEWKDTPLEKMNNHEYWSAWAVMVSAVVLDRRDLFEWSLTQLRTAARQIDRDGYLPNEMARDTRALFYHNYALTPLAMMAAFAHANEVPLQADVEPALRRLASRVLGGADDPRGFEKKAGKKQETRDLAKRSALAWLEPYCWSFSCEPALQQRLVALRPLKTYRVGGNVTDLFASPPSPKVR